MTRRAPEQALHRDVAEYLTYCLGQRTWFSTMPLGGGGYSHGARNKQLGTKKGLPDILVISGGYATWLELKAPKGRVSEAQEACHAALRAAGCGVYIVRSLDDLEAALRDAGVPMKARAA